MDRRAQSLVATGLAFNSRKVYCTGVRHYLRFCRQYQFEPLHLTEVTVLRFIAYLSTLSILVRSIKVYLAGIKSWVIALGAMSQNIYTVRVNWALKSLDRRHPAPRSAAPVSYAMLKHLYDTLPDNYENMMIFTAMTLAFFACLRASEYTFNPHVSPPLLASHIKFF